jgi:hypothetical protein
VYAELRRRSEGADMLTTTNAALDVSAAIFLAQVTTILDSTPSECRLAQDDFGDGEEISKTGSLHDP